MRKLFMVVSAVLAFMYSYAQNVTIKGTIKNAESEPLHGVAIKVKGLKMGTATDATGAFTLSVAPGAVLELSFVGYETRTIELKGRTTIDVVMARKNDAMNDMVVVGYNTLSRKKVTGAISTLSGDAIKNTPAVSFDAMLEGRIPGVTIQSSSGEPGAKTNIIVRGSTNIDYGNANGGNTQPLYVIDGVIFDVNNVAGSYSLSNPLSIINPNDIESIEVLKEASAGAIYGARGGNGVIIVKTRRANNKRPMVSFNAYAGVTTAPRLIAVTTGNAERSLKLALLNNQLSYTDIYNGNIPIQLTDSLNPAFNNNVDWQSMLIRDNAFLNNQDFTVSRRLRQ